MRYEFTVVDVTCEKCEARILDAVQGLPGATGIEVVRTPEDEALVSVAGEEPIATDAVEQAIDSKSAGTEHDYHVRCATGATG